MGKIEDIANKMSASITEAAGDVEKKVNEVAKKVDTEINTPENRERVRKDLNNVGKAIDDATDFIGKEVNKILGTDK